MMRKHEKVDSFLDEVCSRVKAREIHREIRLKLEAILKNGLLKNNWRDMRRKKP